MPTVHDTYNWWWRILCALSPVTTGPPNGSVLFCLLTSVGVVVVVVCNATGGQAGRPPGAWAVGRPTLHGGPVWLRPVRVTSCYIREPYIKHWRAPQDWKLRSRKLLSWLRTCGSSLTELRPGKERVIERSSRRRCCSWFCPARNSDRQTSHSSRYVFPNLNGHLGTYPAIS